MGNVSTQNNFLIVIIWSDFDDIRGFIDNGFSKMKNKEGDLSSLVSSKLFI